MNNQTIAEQLNIKEFPFEIKDKNGNEIYYENSNKSWFKQEFDKNGDIIYYEDSNKFLYKQEYDQNGKEIYYEDSDKFWEKTEFDQNGNLIYWESSNCVIRDNRPKKFKLTIDQIAQEFGIPVEQLKIVITV